VIFDTGELSASIDVTLDDVTAEARRRRNGTFEIHRRPGLETAERRALQRLT
jgi:hypothetical protein